MIVSLECKGNFIIYFKEKLNNDFMLYVDNYTYLYKILFTKFQVYNAYSYHVMIL